MSWRAPTRAGTQDVLGEELHRDPHCSIHQPFDEPGVNVQVGDEAHQPDDQEWGTQHHLLPEVLKVRRPRSNIGRQLTEVRRIRIRHWIKVARACYLVGVNLHSCSAVFIALRNPFLHDVYTVLGSSILNTETHHWPWGNQCTDSST